MVSYNTLALTRQSLEALNRSRGNFQLEVIVVDNDSQDNSAEGLREAFPNLKLIASEENLGFGRANNLGLNEAGGEYVLLVNSDAFVGEKTIQVLIDYLEHHPDVGVAGPMLKNNDGSLQRSCYRFPSPSQAWLENTGLARWLEARGWRRDYDLWAHDNEQEVDFVSGACFMIRRDVYEQVGGFDPGFFLYSEETDWQRRIRDAGWKIAFTPDTEVTHLGGSSGANDRPKINQHFFNSLDRYERKHHGLIGFLMLRSAMVLGSAGRAVAWAIAALIRPNNRSRALAKSRFHRWLALRQLTQPCPRLTPEGSTRR